MTISTEELKRSIELTITDAMVAAGVSANVPLDMWDGIPSRRSPEEVAVEVYAAMEAARLTIAPEEHRVLKQAE